MTIINLRGKKNFTVENDTAKLLSVVGLSNNVYKEFAEKKLFVNIESIEDKLSLIISTTVLGSDIGITIIRGNNVLMINKDQIFDENGKMTEIGLNLLKELLNKLRAEDNIYKNVIMEVRNGIFKK